MTYRVHQPALVSSFVSLVRRLVARAPRTCRAHAPRLLGRDAALVLLLFAALICARAASAQGRAQADFEALPYAPQRVVVYRASAPLTIDGRPDEPSWAATPWSAPFVDIEGDRKPKPRFRTRVKMLWDDEYFYFAAELEEPHIWGTLTRRDAVIFQDNDFEIFIDPDGDTHAYYEFEMNALNTVWDLMLIQPYRDGGPAVNGWDIAGLTSGVHVRGTLNRPEDEDEGWTVEVAMPWTILREAAAGGRAPRVGDQWRVNFSRVEWQMASAETNGTRRYTKRVNPATGQPFPEDNWVWSPQGAINMHMPERWGFVQFSDRPAEAHAANPASFVEDPNDRVKWALRRLYYRQRAFHGAHGRYASDLTALRADDIRVEGLTFRPVLRVTDSLYEIRAEGFDGAILHIRQDGKSWMTRAAAGASVPARP